VGFGEEVTLAVTVVNRKPLPLSWLEIDDEVPRAVTLTRGDLLPSWKPHRGILQQLLTLRWYERVTRRYHLRCHTRGEHVFGPVDLRSGDLFGLARQRLTLPAGQTLLVYPKVVPVAAFGLPSRFPLGDAPSPNRLFRDPSHVAGTRPYVPGDSIRQMHWKATARLGALQVKVDEPSATLSVLLCLNVQTAPRAMDGVFPDLLELLICVTASLATHLLQTRAQVGLITNALLPEVRGPARVPMRRHAQQLSFILSTLARITILAHTSFADVLARERRHAPQGATVVLISGLLDQTLLEHAHAYRAAGHPVSLLLIGDRLRDAGAPGLDARWIGGEDHWRDLPAVEPTARAGGWM
jgi:uncharacterized protein (DUF58 family)